MASFPTFFKHFLRQSKYAFGLLLSQTHVRIHFMIGFRSGSGTYVFTQSFRIPKPTESTLLTGLSAPYAYKLVPCRYSTGSLDSHLPRFGWRKRLRTW